MKKAITLMLALLMAVAVFAGCGAPTESEAPVSEAPASEAPASEAPASEAPASETPDDGDSAGMPYQATELSSGKTYGVSVMTHANPFFLKEVTSVQETLKDVDATVLAPDPANDITKQVQDVTEFCARGVDVIIIDPIDSEGIKPALVEADRAGIPVIIVDMTVADSDLIVSFVESNNVKLGRLAAESLIEAMGGEGEIGIINWSTIQCVRERVQGLEEVIEESYKDKVKIVANQDAFGVVEDAQSIMESFMQSNPNLKGVFCINDPTAQGAIAAIEAANKTGEIFVSSVDGSQNGIDMIKEGKLVCSPVQFPATLANKAVEIAEMCFAGKQDQVEKHIMVDGDNITIDNVADYDGKTY